MTALVLTVCAAIGLASPRTPAPLHDARTIVSMRGEVPLKAPAGWKTERQDAATVLTPGDVAEGKFYAVMVTMKEGNAGSLDEILEDGKKMAAEIGTFSPLHEPKISRSYGGWDYSFVTGTIKTTDRELMAQLMSIKKGDEGGVVVVLSESVETMTHYADTFVEMVRAMGGGKPPPSPANPGPPANSGVVDLQYSVPAGWVEQKVNGFPLLVKEKNELWTKYRFSLLVFPTETLAGSIRDRFISYWKSFVTPNYETSIVPLPLMARLKSGYACAFDAESNPNTLVTVAIYMIVHGGRAVPVMGIFSGTEWTFDKTAEAEIAQFLDTARIPGVSETKAPLFSAESIAGDWSVSGTNFANYITRGGQYAGDATISSAAYFNLGADGSYSRTLMAVGAAGNIREKSSGTWTVDDDELVLSKGGRYSLLGCGAIPNVGRFLVIGNYSDQKVRLKYTNPRGILQAQWLISK